MEHKHFALHDVKADAAARTVEGWASTFGNVDSDNDIIMPGAFAKSLANRRPKMLWQHDQRAPIGLWNAEERPQGLYVKGTISQTECGDEAYTLAKDGVIDSMSIGYSVTDYSIDPKSNIRTIKECTLYEVSLVTFPANEMATITGVKSKPETERDLEKYLRDAGFSRTEAKAIVAGGYKALNQRDADQEPPAVDISRLANLLTQMTA